MEVSHKKSFCFKHRAKGSEVSKYKSKLATTKCFDVLLLCPFTGGGQSMQVANNSALETPVGKVKGPYRAASSLPLAGVMARRQLA